MLVLTPTMFGSLLAGVALWLMFWYGVNHLDSIRYLNQYLSRKMILETGLVFPSRNNTPLGTRNINVDVLRVICKRLEIPNGGMHAAGAVH
jgi:hypothetical protein